MWMILLALGFIAASGLPSVCLARRATTAALIGGSMLIVGAACGMWPAIQTLITGTTDTMAFITSMPFGPLRLVLDSLAAFFLVPIFLIGVAGAFYGLGYWRAAGHPRSGPHVRLFYGCLVASMGLVVLAGDGVGFLIAWEIMSLSAFAAITAEDHRRSVRQAGWLYLVNTHLSMLILFAMFALWNAVSGSFAFQPLDPAAAAPGVRTAIFLMALVAFGCKAGMMPLHFWLPDAHANAPSHVSALLSGVVIKMGIYGLVRVGLLLLPEPPLSWGVLVLMLGVTSAILGVAFALSQHDLKRLLAYHSIENIGIILMGLGIALIGAYAHRPAWTALGLAGCLLHVWNHGLFKSLLFLAAGAVIMKSHTRQIDRLGGRAKAMPYTAAAFLLGAVAICGLPPLNGFVSEWLVYLGLLGPFTGTAPGEYQVLALAAPALAVVGALAVACFVKVYGTVFLGLPRQRMARGGDVPNTMRVPMGVLGACCVLIGVLPVIGVAAVVPAISQALGASRASVSLALAPAGALQPWTVSIALALLVSMGLSYLYLRRRPAATAGTWDCGYVQPSPRMQYTASSFAASILDMFRWILRPHGPAVRLTALFPPLARFCSHVGDVVLDGWLIPLWAKATHLLVDRRTRQQGSIQRYLLYICLALAVLLLSLMPWRELWNWLLARG